LYPARDATYPASRDATYPASRDRDEWEENEVDGGIGMVQDY